MLHEQRASKLRAVFLRHLETRSVYNVGEYDDDFSARILPTSSSDHSLQQKKCFPISLSAI